ncbi:MAG: carbamate kinase, partial [Gemmatimonadota bacterium]
MRVVVALGGNALLRRDEDGTRGPVGMAHLHEAVSAITTIAAQHEVILTHGNGPQVGLLALQAEAYDPEHPTGLDLLGAESEGLIGYLLARELGNRLPDRVVTAVLTQVLVNRDDPAFQDPDKPIGPGFPESEARRLAKRKGWTVGPDGGEWRRLVASPRPQAVLEAESLSLLVDAGVLVICGGGGGIPVTRDSDGKVRGVEAVVDKDATAVVLARVLDAGGLVLLTDVPGVMEEFGTPEARLRERMTPAEARSFPGEPGTMGPKLRACAD